MTADDLLEGIDAEKLEYRLLSRPQPRTSREFRCPECNARCTGTNTERSGYR